MKNYRDQDGCNNCRHSFYEWGSLQLRCSKVLRPDPLPKDAPLEDRQERNMEIAIANHVRPFGTCDTYQKYKPQDQCPNCGGMNITVSWQTEEIPYGIGTAAVVLAASVPIRKCEGCGQQFTADDAEDIKQAAIDRHLAAKGAGK